jgi:hypothetical protein
MPRKKKEEIGTLTVTSSEGLKLTTTPTPSNESVVVATPFSVDKTSFDVHTAQGGYVRTYTVEIHGEDAEKLANQYASKIGGTVK